MTEKSVRHFTDEQINKIASMLEGTCGTLYGVLDRLYDTDEDAMSLADCHALDDLVFCCEQCNWWFEQGEMGENASDAWVCVECCGSADSEEE